MNDQVTANAVSPRDKLFVEPEPKEEMGGLLGDPEIDHEEEIKLLDMEIEKEKRQLAEKEKLLAQGTQDLAQAKKKLIADQLAKVKEEKHKLLV